MLFFSEICSCNCSLNFFLWVTDYFERVTGLSAVQLEIVSSTKSDPADIV